MKFAILRPAGASDDPDLEERDTSISPDEPWYLEEEVDTGSEIDQKVWRPEFYGWLHDAGKSREDATSVVERARRNEGRLPVIVGALSEVVKAFASRLSSEDAGLFVVLKNYDQRGMQILGEMMNRAPYSFGAQILRHRIPDYGSYEAGDKYLGVLCVLLFVAMPFGGRRAVMLWRSEEEKDGFAELLRQRGLKSEAKIREALFTIGVCYWMKEFARSIGDAVRFAGGKSPDHTRELLRKVLGIESLAELRKLPIEEVIRRADEYIVLNPQRSPPLPQIELPPAVLARRMRRDVESALARKEALGTLQGGWLESKVLEGIMLHWFPTVTALVGSRIRKGAGRQDAIMLVFEKVAELWKRSQIFDKVSGDHQLKMTREEQHASLAKVSEFVLSNAMRRKHRREDRLVSIQDIAEEDRNHPARSDDPLAQLEAEEMHGLVERVIATFPFGKAEIVRARFFEELSNDEVAAEFGVTLGYVATVISQVRRKIAMMLNGLQG